MTRRTLPALLCMLALDACNADSEAVNSQTDKSAQQTNTGGAGAQTPPQMKPDTKGGPALPPKGDSAKPPAGAAPAPAAEALSDKKRNESPSVSEADRNTLAQGNRGFGWALYAELKKTDGNLFFSPYSVSSALAMTYAGAKNRTADEMAATMHFELPGERLHAAFNAIDRELTTPPARAGDEPAPFTLDVANALWAQQGKPFLAAYLDTLATNYGAGMRLLDFAADADGARRTINDWVEDKTHDRIKDLLQPDDVTPDTVLVLTNAIYFKAKWVHDFQEAATKDAPFHAPAGDQTAKMMHAVITTSYARGEGYQAVVLPYAASATDMLLILPDSGKLGDVESRLDDKLLGAIASDAQGYMVTLSLPRFRFESRSDVSQTLETLGMRDAFTDAADFSGMDGARDIHLSSVIHKAFVAVDEKGTEAAAATAVTAVATSAPAQMPEVEVAFDRPFILAIRTRPSGDILFLGRVQSVVD